MTSRAARNIGGLVTTKTALRPVAQANATAYSVTGVVINRSQFQSLLLHWTSGLKTGAPTTILAKAKLRECATAGGTFSDVAVGPSNAAVAFADITDQNQDRWLEIDLSGCMEFIRVDLECVFTGGASPTLLMAIEAVLGGGPVIPSLHS